MQSKEKINKSLITYDCFMHAMSKLYRKITGLIQDLTKYYKTTERRLREQSYSK